MWTGRPVRELLGYVKAAMPPAGRQPDEDTLTAIVAYILRENGAAPGGPGAVFGIGGNNRPLTTGTAGRTAGRLLYHGLGVRVEDPASHHGLAGGPSAAPGS